MTSFVVDAGDGSDFVSTGTLQVPVSVLGGPGDDSLSGGMAADVLDGGPGDDGITVQAGDSVSGGSGIDTASPSFGWDVSVNLSLDGIADDGSAGAARTSSPMSRRRPRLERSERHHWKRRRERVARQ